MAATIVTNSVRHSVYGQGSIYLGWNYQYKEFTFLEIRKSPPANTMPFSAAISVNVHHGIHGTLQLDETPWDHILIQMFACTAQERKTSDCVTEVVHGSVVLLLQQCSLYVHLLMCNLEFQCLKNFNSYDGIGGE
jgi:hypothetical protein